MLHHAIWDCNEGGAIYSMFSFCHQNCVQRKVARTAYLDMSISGWIAFTGSYNHAVAQGEFVATSDDDSIILSLHRRPLRAGDMIVNRRKVPIDQPSLHTQPSVPLACRSPPAPGCRRDASLGQLPGYAPRTAP